MLSIEAALMGMPGTFFNHYSIELEAAIASSQNIPDLTHQLLQSEDTRKASRLVSCLHAAGRKREAQIIEQAFQQGGLDLSSSKTPVPEFGRKITRPQSALIARIAALWGQYDKALNAFIDRNPNLLGDNSFFERKFADIEHKISEIYINDAYNSLSIEGYQVNNDLIQRVEAGKWDSVGQEKVRSDKDALAARGYYEAFQNVKASLRKIHEGAPWADTIANDLLEWRGALFAPSVRAGLLPMDAMAGYRNKPVFISGSRHVPPASEKLMDAMEAFEGLLKNQANPWKRAVLGHFFFVYLHPFADGNGRVARFILNVCLVTGGLPWTVISVAGRAEYMDALEQASVHGNIEVFAKHVLKEMQINSENRVHSYGP